MNHIPGWKIQKVFERKKTVFTRWIRTGFKRDSFGYTIMKTLPGTFTFWVQSAAISALLKIKPEIAIEPLIEVLQDNDYSVRLMAAKALGVLKSEKAVPSLTQALKDKDARVRDAAEGALKEIRSDTQ